MLRVLLIICVSSLASIIDGYGGFCFLPSSVDVQLTSSCSDFPVANDTITLFAAKNSKVSFQILLDPTPQSHTNNLEFKDTDDYSFSYNQVGYVNVTNTTRYNQQRIGWLPDPLITAGNMGDTATSATYCESGISCTFFVEVDISADATAGAFTGEVDLLYNDGNSNIPYVITIWDFALPNLKDSKFTSLFVASTSDAMHTLNLDQDLNNIYEETGYTVELKEKYYNMLTEARIPPDDLYLSSPRPLEDYQYLSSVGQRLFGVLDVSSLEGGDGCSNFTDDYVRNMLKVRERASREAKS